MKIDKNGPEQGKDKRQEEDAGKNLRAKHVAKCVTRNDQKAAPVRRQPAIVSFECSLNNCHEIDSMIHFFIDSMDQ
jgi:hypothetical protein